MVYSVLRLYYIFFFNDTATTEIYTLSLHDALPIFVGRAACDAHDRLAPPGSPGRRRAGRDRALDRGAGGARSEEHTSELQSRQYLVCRLLLEKKKKNTQSSPFLTTVTPFHT